MVDFVVRQEFRELLYVLADIFSCKKFKVRAYVTIILNVYKLWQKNIKVYMNIRYNLTNTFACKLDTTWFSCHACHACHDDCG
jgi:hypothetical protein